MGKLCRELFSKRFFCREDSLRLELSDIFHRRGGGEFQN